MDNRRKWRDWLIGYICSYGKLWIRLFAAFFFYFFFRFFTFVLFFSHWVTRVNDLRKQLISVQIPAPILRILCQFCESCLNFEYPAPILWILPPLPILIDNLSPNLLMYVIAKGDEINLLIKQVKKFTICSIRNFSNIYSLQWCQLFRLLILLSLTLPISILPSHRNLHI